MTAPTSEIEAKADFSIIRYAQCWEDADLLVGGLDVMADDHVLSIASAGDNSLSLLACGPKSVAAIDLNETQLFCLEARIAAYRHLSHPELLQLMGSRPCEDRARLWQRLGHDMSDAAAAYFDTHMEDLKVLGLGGMGRFERYFSLFRDHILPLMHNKSTIDQLLVPKSQRAREDFFDTRFANWRFKLLTRVFFSKFVMGRLGRDPAFFAYVKEPFSTHIQRRIRHGLVDLDPSLNPYLHWILYGTHGAALPHALREEPYRRIRQNLDRLSLHLMSTEAFAAQNAQKISVFNLSNIFEYMSEDNFKTVFSGLLEMAAPHARFAYWNMMVPRRASQHFGALRYQESRAKTLYAQDKAIFYRDFVLECLA
jgi:S-adenosylmethionine-diacylglycerol 3-amino-3-carboxypropyl transferase